MSLDIDPLPLGVASMAHHVEYPPVDEVLAELKQFGAPAERVIWLGASSIYLETDNNAQYLFEVPHPNGDPLLTRILQRPIVPSGVHQAAAFLRSSGAPQEERVSLNESLVMHDISRPGSHTSGKFVTGKLTSILWLPKG